VRGKWDPDVPSLQDFTAPDVFGPEGWFGTRGLGFEAWRALILLEDTNGALPAAVLRKELGAGADRALRKLLRLHVVVKRGGSYVRGSSTLADAARALRTLGTRTWKHAHHVAERTAYRGTLSAGQRGLGADDVDEEQHDLEAKRARVLELARRYGFPRVLCDGGEEAWRRQVSRASRESLKTMSNALNWYARRKERPETRWAR
jgi:hypothetical protein